MFNYVKEIDIIYYIGTYVVFLLYTRGYISR